jgi:hypothetical protein
MARLEWFGAEGRQPAEAEDSGPAVATALAPHAMTRPAFLSRLISETILRPIKDGRIHTDRIGHPLPDFVFLRSRDIELDGGFLVGGTLVTDIPKGRKPSRRDRLFILQIMAELRKILKSAPDFDEASFWRLRSNQLTASPLHLMKVFWRTAVAGACASW